MIGLFLLAAFIAALVPLNRWHRRELARMTPEERRVAEEDYREESRVW